MNKIKSVLTIIMTMITMTVMSGCAETGAVETQNPFQTENTTTTTVNVQAETTTQTEQTVPETTTKLPSEPAITEAPVTTTESVDETVEMEPTVNNNIDRTSTCDYISFKKAPERTSIAYNPTNVNNMFYVFGNDYSWVFWNFTNKGIVGVGLDSEKNTDVQNVYSNTENVAYTEMYYGFTATIEDDRYLNITHYYNVSDVDCVDMKITYMDGTNPRYTVAPDKSITADLYDKSFVNGYYALTATYNRNGTEYTANLYMLVNYASDNTSDCKAYICYGNDDHVDGHESPTKRRENLQDMITTKGITPENSLKTGIAYPYEAVNMIGGKYDTNFWVDKSYEILKGHENASDSFKATLLHDWMTENLIYDDYKQKVLQEARYYMDYVSGKNYVSQINIGVCRDYVNIYTIMCREQGIPCIIFGSESKGHVWNAIWLDNEWKEVDLTGDINRFARTASTTDVTPATIDNTHSYRYFCNYTYLSFYPDDTINKYLHFQ